MKTMDVRAVTGDAVTYIYQGVTGTVRPGEEVPFGVGYLQVLRSGGRVSVRRLSGSRNVTYTVTLTPGETYRLGARYGHRLRKASEERDPLLRVLREEEVPVSRLVRMEEGENLEYVEHLRDVSRFSSPASMTRWHSDGVAERGDKVVLRRYDHINPHCFPDSEEVGVIQDAHWAILETIATTLGGGLSRDITRVHVWPSCDAEELRQAIRDIRAKITRFPKTVTRGW